MQNNCLLTGGTGFFGKALLRHYLTSRKPAFSQIAVLSRNPEKFLSEYPEFSKKRSIIFLEGDIQQHDTLPWDHSFTHILHAATDSTIGPSLTPLQRYDQIVYGTRNILNLAVATGARRFLLTSSGGIYGPQPHDLAAIPEDWSGNLDLSDPSNAYSQAKRAAEHLCTLYREAHRVETIITRCFAFVGPDLPLNAHFAIGNFIQDALSAEQITVAGDGSPLRTYLHQSDLAHWLWTLLIEGVDGETYNVGSDRVISIGDLAFKVRDLIAPHKSVRILGVSSDLAAIRNRYIPSISKIKLLHNLSPRVTLEDAILSTVDALRGRVGCDLPFSSSAVE